METPKAFTTEISLQSPIQIMLPYFTMTHEDGQSVRSNIQNIHEDVRALLEHTNRQITEACSKMDGNNCKWLIGMQITILLAVLTSILAILLTSM